MLLRLILIFALLFQPLAYTWGAAPCRNSAQQDHPACCPQVEPCCTLGALLAAEVHHCGNPAALCNCNSSGPQQPTEPPANPSREHHAAAAILPRLLSWAVPDAQPLAAAPQPQRCQSLYGGRDLLAFVCLLLT